MVFTLSCSANAKANAASDSVPFVLEGQKFPSYSTFREALNQQIFAAKNRVCVLTQRLDDRELALALFSASRRAVLTALRVSLKKKTTEREERRLEELSFLGIQILKKPLTALKMQSPTLLAIDGRAWSVSSELLEYLANEVTIEPAALTATEVCRWAEDAAGAKAATRR
ncbi:MAG: hypothetical protein RJB13_1840 [Pseudomonadota bacterium]|jgi:hypothetical protein